MPPLSSVRFSSVSPVSFVRVTTVLGGTPVSVSSLTTAMRLAARCDDLSANRRCILSGLNTNVTSLLVVNCDRHFFRRAIVQVELRGLQKLIGLVEGFARIQSFFGLGQLTVEIAFGLIKGVPIFLLVLDFFIEPLFSSFEARHCSAVLRVEADFFRRRRLFVAGLR